MSLIAVMMAMVLLGIGTMAIGAAQAGALRAQSASSRRTTALTAARMHLEALRAIDPYTIAEETGVQVGDDGRPSATGSFTRSTRVTVLRTNLIRVDVAMSGAGLTTPLVLSTHVYRGARVVGP